MADSKSAKLWGGRFAKEPNEIFFQFNRSFGFDARLLAADVLGSLAHGKMLLSAGILKSVEFQKIETSLAALLADVEKNPGLLNQASVEDVHSFIEGWLTKDLGEIGKKIHSGRSRNDQVATALRVWLKSESDATRAELKDLGKEILSLAEKGRDLPMPAYTHMQRAQPVLWAHWCLAYFEMLSRDLERLDSMQDRLATLPLGSGALAGTGLPLDRKLGMKALGFQALSRNSLDAVSDRDFAIEWASFASILMMHLSRLCEDLILFATHEFAFITLGDEVSSGSSLMPQKKNPDALELIRGKTGRVYGALTTLLTMMKGLPLAYNKDLQEDKEALFTAVDTARLCLKNMQIVLKHVSPRTEKLRQESEKGYMNATDLADLCVLAGMPFREAHEKIGELVRLGLKEGKELHELDVGTLLRALPLLTADALKILNIDALLKRKSALGSTGAQAVAGALEEARARWASK